MQGFYISDRFSVEHRPRLGVKRPRAATNGTVTFLHLIA